MKRKKILIAWAIGFFIVANVFAQNPHGEKLAIDCAACHSPESWAIASTAWDAGELVRPVAGTSQKAFSHKETGFPLTGQHASLDCRECHDNLVFGQANGSCISCHTDLHQMTAGDDCMRCHNTNNWLVDDIDELHFENGFPLLGQHAVISCDQCHSSETALRFDRIGNDCINCHLDDFQATTAPNHEAAGYSTNCMECHDVASQTWLWTSGTANHNFFPLTGGHAIQDCNACHSNGTFAGTPTECFACHEDDYLATTSPDHQANGFPTDCSACHAIEPGWPAQNFDNHDDLYFPIFSGKHKGEWNDCIECHTVAGDFSQFSCIDCHEHNDANKLAKKHDEVGGYQYNSQACYQCHPKGDE